jgi:hypothetical protein
MVLAGHADREEGEITPGITTLGITVVFFVVDTVLADDTLEGLELLGTVIAATEDCCDVDGEPLAELIVPAGLLLLLLPF